MTDVHTKSQRTKNMAAIRSSGNKSTEIAFLNLLKRHKITGWRRHDKRVIGKPDFSFQKQKVAVFLDGCFWHGCPECNFKPKTNAEFWNKKITQNIKRDCEKNKLLKEKNWRIVRIWEHELKITSDNHIEKVMRYLSSR